jgi:hypothetical protein
MNHSKESFTSCLDSSDCLISLRIGVNYRQDSTTSSGGQP